MKNLEVSKKDLNKENRKNPHNIQDIFYPQKGQDNGDLSIEIQC